ncbi:MAG TPA: alpha-glucuronidase [Bacteroidetes bacterium]|nr:alpha-glucuronidase [Bacteroidota bacterium]
MRPFSLFLCILFLFIPRISLGENNDLLWLGYHRISDERTLEQYRNTVSAWMIEGDSETLRVAGEELQRGLDGLLGTSVPRVNRITRNGTVVAGTPGHSERIASMGLKKRLETLGEEGYLIVSDSIDNKKVLVIAANRDIGVLYGVFHLLRMMQTCRDIGRIELENSPETDIRVLNHWDNLDRTVERGYAGFSLWDWHRLPGYISPVYREYARMNASVGINGTVLNNVNANALILTPRYLKKVAALADVFRPYGIRVYLSARFSAPVETGNLKTADPLDEEVRAWWNDKAGEIYRYIPDFGGFLVKANSEGQPGPQDYGRTHADGANMLADALDPHGGIVMWRAFVYDNRVPEDRAKQAYNEFVPLDGHFRDNVLVQVKNGPIDFQPREPFHPLFGAMPQTPLMMEFQITQEYLGFATHLVYLGTLFKECLDADTYARGKGSTVARVIDGSLENKKISGMAGVANTGNDRNWTGHPFGQANWFCFGRLAWDPYLDAGDIAEEWIRMTFGNRNDMVYIIKNMMMASREIAVHYMTPLGLHHIMAEGHHYGPGPWVSSGRPDWTSVYYHQADSEGIGFDRTRSGSNALEQYHPPVRDLYENPETCPEEYLLWFHHLPWDFTMSSGKTLWEELCYRYYRGAENVVWLRNEWEKTKEWVDRERFEQVRMLLKIQEKEADWWRNACVLYFQSVSGKPIPEGLEPPEHDLSYYENLRFHYVPGH